MGKSKWFCPTAKPRNNRISKKTFSKFLRLTAMAWTLERAQGEYYEIFYSANQIASINHFLLSKNMFNGLKPAAAAIWLLCITENFCEISM